MLRFVITPAPAIFRKQNISRGVLYFAFSSYYWMNYFPSYSTVIFTAKEQPEFAFSSNKNQLNTNFFCSLLKHCSEWIHISFYQVLKLETWPWESHSATAGTEALLGDICHQPLLSWNIQFLAASCTLNKQASKKPAKQKDFQEFSKSSLKQKWIWENLTYFPATHPSEKFTLNIMWIVHWALHRLVWITT